MRSQETLVVAALAMLQTCAVAESPELAKRQPLISLEGRWSGVSKESYCRIQSPEAYRKLMLAHQTVSQESGKVPDTLPALEVDFNRFMVIAVFEGKGSCCIGIRVHSILESDNYVTVRVQAQTYQTGLISGVVNDDSAQAYGIFVLPRTRKQVAIEMDTRGDLAAPPEWTKYAELAPGNQCVGRSVSNAVVAPLVFEIELQLARLWESISPFEPYRTLLQLSHFLPN